MGLKRKITTLAAGILPAAWPWYVFADQLPDDLSQELDPDFIGCMIAVDDAEHQFRGHLQDTCSVRMAEICEGRDRETYTSQVVDCLHFETEQGVAFLGRAVEELPAEVTADRTFLERSDARNRKRLETDISALQERVTPERLYEALEHAVDMVVSVKTLFWLAREAEVTTEVSEQHLQEPHEPGK